MLTLTYFCGPTTNISEGKPEVECPPVVIIINEVGDTEKPGDYYRRKRINDSDAVDRHSVVVVDKFPKL